MLEISFVKNSIYLFDFASFFGFQKNKRNLLKQKQRTTEKSLFILELSHTFSTTKIMSKFCKFWNRLWKFFLTTTDNFNLLNLLKNFTYDNSTF